MSDFNRQSHDHLKRTFVVITELKNRRVQDIFIACVNGLKGFSEAIEAVFPETQVQLCIVHWLDIRSFTFHIKTVKKSSRI
jgi:transposase-like protein